MTGNNPFTSETNPTPPTPSHPQLIVSLAPQVNFASHQNSIPVIREIEIRNPAPHALTDLTLQLTASPAFLTPKSWTIDRISPNDNLYIVDRDTNLDGQYLLSLTEAIQGEVHFNLLSSTGETLHTQSHTIEVLARNEWGGYNNSPELLAAFSMPNDPIIDQLLRSTSDLLRQTGEEPTLLSYDQATPERIWLQASATWTALLNLKLDYALPPSSFEQGGQKIRTPSDIHKTRRATCLDTTMLLASIFEQMHLHPIVILEQGHAFLGLWLIEDTFNHAYTEELHPLRTRVQLKEIIVLETTFLPQGHTFDAALQHAQNNLMNNDHKFIGAIDIRRARDARIRPLTFINTPISALADINTQSPSSTTTVLRPGADIHRPDATWEATPTGPGGRLGQWQRRLLDLSLRNPLLSMRTNRLTIPLIAPDPGKLEDLLAAGKNFSIESAFDNTARDRAIHSHRTGEHLDDQIALAALNKGILYVPEEPNRLDSTLVNLYRRARNDLEEGGSNTLYLAIGVLHWQRTGIASRTYRAPLILMPVNMTRKSVRSGVRLTLNDDEPRFNTTLLEMLRQDFELDITGLDGDLPSDESGTDITAILTHVRENIKDIPGFEVRNEVILGIFSFAKYLMWKDLVDRTDDLKRNRVVEHLIERPGETFIEDTSFVSPAELDQTVPPQTLYTPLSSDSSQLAAVIAGAAGKNFVMIGPPGTGKSQTIANMIAHNLGLGRTVLFVSEKAAALDVVYRRLREQGLGDFCLELHSNKARKLDVITQLGKAWQANPQPIDDQWNHTTEKYKQIRDKLNTYVNTLHHTHTPGFSIRTAISLAAANPDTPTVPLQFPHTDSHNSTTYEELLKIGDRIDLNLKQVGELPNHPLSLIRTKTWTQAWQSQLLQQAKDFADASQTYMQYHNALLQRYHIPPQPITHAFMNTIASLAELLPRCHGHSLEFAFSDKLSTITESVQKLSQNITEFKTTEAKLSCPYNRDRYLQADLTPATQLWQKSITSWWLPRILNAGKCRKYLILQVGASQKPDPGNDLFLLEKLQQIHTNIQDCATHLSSLKGWAGLQSDIEQLNTIVHLANKLRDLSITLTSDPGKLLLIRQSIRQTVVDANDLLHETGPLTLECKAWLTAWKNFQQQLSNFATTINQQPDHLINQADINLNPFTQIHQIIQPMERRLHAWCAWQRVRDEALDAQLHPLIQQLEDGTLQPGNTRHIIAVNYARWWSGRIIDETPLLRDFVSIEHEQKIVNFSHLDTQVQQLTSQVIRARLRQNTANIDQVKRNSEFGIIRREIEKKIRHKPLRQLLREAPNAIHQLTPCFLMSPLSIAQYLPVDMKPFDVVIFDEASQITVWDAIGAIARGNQAIVVGDPKQLPPTNFFNSSQSPDEDSDVEEDLESILDEMLASNIPTINLSWHYRSRHESLITFSNHRYYDNNQIGRAHV